MRNTGTFDMRLRQEIWDGNYETILTPHFGNLAYKIVAPPDAAVVAPREYSNEEALWRDLRTGPLREHGSIVLQGFRLFDYVPRAPGLYHDADLYP
jgi:hypothetical protein